MSYTVHDSKTSTTTTAYVTLPPSTKVRPDKTNAAGTTAVEQVRIQPRAVMLPPGSNWYKPVPQATTKAPAQTIIQGVPFPHSNGPAPLTVETMRLAPLPPANSAPTTTRPPEAPVVPTRGIVIMDDMDVR